MIEVELISYTQNPVNVIESAASTCYDSTPTDGRIMNHCYNNGVEGGHNHMSEAWPMPMITAIAL